MKINNIILIAALAIILSGCSLFDEKVVEKTHVVTETVIKEYEDVTKPDPVDLDVVQYEMPRDQQADLIIKNITACLNAPDKTTVEFWTVCGERPIVLNSNVFLGFDKDNYNKNVKNFNALKQKIKEYDALIDVVNKQRAKDREANKNKKDSK